MRAAGSVHQTRPQFERLLLLLLLLVSPPVAAIVCESVFLLLGYKPSFNQPFFGDASIQEAGRQHCVLHEADPKHDEDNEEDDG